MAGEDLRDLAPTTNERITRRHEATKGCRGTLPPSWWIAATRLHIEAGPGLLESVYEVVLAKMLAEQGLAVKRQVPVPIRLMDLTFDEGFRADLLVEDTLLVELKSVENLAAVHSKQVLTYLRLLKLPLGLLINFGAPTFKEGCKRIVNGPQSFVSSRLRVNQNQGLSADGLMKESHEDTKGCGGAFRHRGGLRIYHGGHPPQRVGHAAAS